MANTWRTRSLPIRLVRAVDQDEFGEARQHVPHVTRRQTDDARLAAGSLVHRDHVAVAGDALSKRSSARVVVARVAGGLGFELRNDVVHITVDDVLPALEQVLVDARACGRDAASPRLQPWTLRRRRLGSQRRS
jgi:hypothetical protein